MKLKACLTIFCFFWLSYSVWCRPQKALPQKSGFGLEVMEYIPGESSIRLKTPTHIAFGPGNREIITDLKNNRFVFREGPEAPFEVSPVPM